MKHKSFNLAYHPNFILALVLVLFMYLPQNISVAYEHAHAKKIKKTKASDLTRKVLFMPLPDSIVLTSMNLKKNKFRGKLKKIISINLKANRNFLKKEWAKMVKIPGYYFKPGCPEWQDSCKDKSKKEVFVDEFYLDKFEVTVGEYERCVKDGFCSPPSISSPIKNIQCLWKERKKYRDYPVNCVSYQQADRFCQYLGKRLPTELEWEYASRTYENRVFPWGNIWHCNNACISGSYCPPGETPGVMERRSPCKTGMFKKDKSGFDIYDMAGNVSEWVAPSRGSDKFNYFVIKGGNFLTTGVKELFLYERKELKKDMVSPNVGFRCASSVPLKSLLESIRSGYLNKKSNAQ